MLGEVLGKKKSKKHGFVKSLFPCKKKLTCLVAAQNLFFFRFLLPILVYHLHIIVEQSDKIDNFYCHHAVQTKGGKS